MKKATKSLLGGIAVLSLFFHPAPSALSEELSPTELEETSSLVINGDRLKDVYEQTKNKIRQKEEAAEVGWSNEEPVMVEMEDAQSTMDKPSPAETLDHDFLANDTPEKVVEALDYEPSRIYRFLLTHPAALARSEEVLNAAQTHSEYDNISQVERETRSAALRALAVGLKAQAEWASSATPLRLDPVPAAFEGAITEGQN